MLQSRLSPSLFTQHQYGSPPSRRTSITTARRSLATSPSTPALAPPPKPVYYVSRGTQYSPPMQTTMENSAPEPAVKQAAQNSHPVTVVSSSNIEPTPMLQAPPSPTLNPGSGSVVRQESPILKRRQEQKQEEAATTSGAVETAGAEAKRSKPANGPVKVLPIRYELCEVEDIVILIANMISELIETNDGLPLRQGVLTRFHSRTPPGISVLDYLQRLAKHATLTPPILLSMVYYIDRLCSLYPAFTITTLTVHRFLITAATVAAKGLSDSFWNNSTYARVGGIKIAELGLLELDFLYRVDWKIVPNPEVLVEYYRGLVARSAGYELEGDGEETSSDEDDLLDSPSPEAANEAATNSKWKEWMDNVSTQTSGRDDVPSGATEAGVERSPRQ